MGKFEVMSTNLTKQKTSEFRLILQEELEKINIQEILCAAKDTLLLAKGQLQEVFDKLENIGFHKEAREVIKLVRDVDHVLREVSSACQNIR